MPQTLNNITGSPEKDLVVETTIGDNDFIRIVTSTGASRIISFYNSVKAYVNSVLNTALDKMLKSDGSVNMDTGYTPTQDLSLSTKKYVDDTKNTLETMINSVDSNIRNSIKTNIQYVSLYTDGLISKPFNSNSLVAIPLDFSAGIAAALNLNTGSVSSGIVKGLNTHDVYEVRFTANINLFTGTNVYIAFNGITSDATSNVINKNTYIIKGNKLDIVVIGVSDGSDCYIQMNTIGVDIDMRDVQFTVKHLDMNI